MGLLFGNPIFFYETLNIYYIYSKPTEVNIGEVTYEKNQKLLKKRLPFPN